MLPVLTTPRLVLRPAAEDDLDAVWRLLILPDVRRYLCDDRVMSREEVAGVIAEHVAVSRQGLGMWIAEHEGRFTGFAALKQVADALVALIPALKDEVEPTIAFDPALWRRGFASEALAAVLAHGFGTLSLARIAGICDVPNTASARMLARAGFVETGEHPGVYYRVKVWNKEKQDALF